MNAKFDFTSLGYSVSDMLGETKTLSSNLIIPTQTVIVPFERDIIPRCAELYISNSNYRASINVGDIIGPTRISATKDGWIDFSIYTSGSIKLNNSKHRFDDNPNTRAEQHCSLVIRVDRNRTADISIGVHTFSLIALDIIGLSAEFTGLGNIHNSPMEYLLRGTCRLLWARYDGNRKVEEIDTLGTLTEYPMVIYGDLNCPFEYTELTSSDYADNLIRRLCSYCLGTLPEHDIWYNKKRLITDDGNNVLVFENE